MTDGGRVCGMILTPLVSERGEPTGLSLACSSSVIAEALNSQLMSKMITSSARDQTSVKGQAIVSKFTNAKCTSLRISQPVQLQ